ncbi:MAG: hypothetical protein Q8N77_02970 [Nanoarchaeota archaeon]|nr:hypothetical protein [Nanoarchaeota archaeon]
MKVPEMFVPNKCLDEKTEELLAERKELLAGRKRKFEYAPQFNMFKSSDEREQYFYDLWCEQAFTSDNDQKHAVVESYLLNVLGVSKQVFEDFKEMERDAYYQVGMLQGGARERKSDFKSFWGDMHKLYPVDYSKEDIDFLVESEVYAVFALIDQFQTYGANGLLTKLKTNANVFK